MNDNAQRIGNAIRGIKAIETDNEMDEGYIRQMKILLHNMRMRYEEGPSDDEICTREANVHWFNGKKCPQCGNMLKDTEDGRYLTDDNKAVNGVDCINSDCMFGFHYPAYATKEDAEKEYDKVCGQSGIKGEVKYDPHKIGELIEGGETRFKCRGCPVMCEITMNGKNLVTPTECPYGHFRVDWQEVKDIEREGRTDCSKCIYYRKTFNRPPQLHDSTLLYEVQDEIVEDNMWKKIWCIHNMRMTKPMCPMFDDGKEVK